MEIIISPFSEYGPTHAPIPLTGSVWSFYHNVSNTSKHHTQSSTKDLPLFLSLGA